MERALAFVGKSPVKNPLRVAGIPDFKEVKLAPRVLGLGLKII